MKIMWGKTVIYKCTDCHEEVVEDSIGLCSACEEMHNQKWLRAIQIEDKRMKRKRKVATLIDRIPELIRTLEVTGQT